MSHTYSRTQSLLDEFSKCFSYADEVILHKIYSSARENPEDFEITGKTLFEKVKENYKNPENVFYFEEVLDAKDFVLSELAKPLEKGKNGYLFDTTDELADLMRLVAHKDNLKVIEDARNFALENSI